jgi:hypothetical protein
MKYKPEELAETLLKACQVAREAPETCRYATLEAAWQICNDLLDILEEYLNDAKAKFKWTAPDDADKDEEGEGKGEGEGELRVTVLPGGRVGGRRQVFLRTEEGGDARREGSHLGVIPRKPKRTLNGPI